MKEIDIDLIESLFIETVCDLESIWKRCFQARFKEKPSNSYYLLLGSMFDLWGSIFKNDFDINNKSNTKENVTEILLRLKEKNKKDYNILFNKNMNGRVTDEVANNIIQLLRHKSVHTFSRGGANPDISSKGNEKPFKYKYIKENKGFRWCINIEKVKNDFLDCIKVDVPKFILASIQENEEDVIFIRFKGKKYIEIDKNLNDKGKIKLNETNKSLIIILDSRFLSREKKIKKEEEASKGLKDGNVKILRLN